MKKKILSAEFAAVVVLALFAAVTATIGRADVCTPAEKIRVSEADAGKVMIEICAKGADGGDWTCSYSKTFSRSDLKSQMHAEGRKAALSGGLAGALSGFASGFKTGAVAGGPLGILTGIGGGIVAAVTGAITGGVSGYKLSSYKASSDAIEMVIKSKPGTCKPVSAADLEGKLLPSLLAGLEHLEHTNPKNVVDNIEAKALVDEAMRENEAMGSPSAMGIF